jgi:hypothetical protein
MPLLQPCQRIGGIQVLVITSAKGVWLKKDSEWSSTGWQCSELCQHPDTAVRNGRCSRAPDAVNCLSTTHFSKQPVIPTLMLAKKLAEQRQ